MQEELRECEGRGAMPLRPPPEGPRQGQQLALCRAAMACSAARCACPSFFYIVAQGAWILRCRCKHKHTEHDPGSHGCARPTCACSKFDSPWVCNCDHPWASHTQLLQESDARSLQELVLEGEQVSEADALDLIKRGSIDTPGTS
eukprot:jgi/Mesen1/949/ME000118S00118